MLYREQPAQVLLQWDSTAVVLIQSFKISPIRTWATISPKGQLLEGRGRSETETEASGVGCDPRTPAAGAIYKGNPKGAEERLC